MDTDVNIFHRQMNNESKERYILWKRLKELTKELEEVIAKLEKYK